jgi:hypothetical protein
MRGKDLALLLAAAGAGLWLANRLRQEATRYNFMGKVVLITGGSRGLGLVLARAESGRRRSRARRANRPCPLPC